VTPTTHDLSQENIVTREKKIVGLNSAISQYYITYPIIQIFFFSLSVFYYGCKKTYTKLW